MKNSVLIEGTLLLLISLIGLAEAIRLIIDLDPNMVSDVLGPGYYILFLSLGLLVTGILHIAINHKKRNSTITVEVNPEFRNRMIGMISILVFYTLALDFLGYLISSFLFFILEFSIVGIKSWRTNIFLSTVFTTFYYVVFVKYFNIVFPREIF